MQHIYALWHLGVYFPNRREIASTVEMGLPMLNDKQPFEMGYFIVVVLIYLVSALLHHPTLTLCEFSAKMVIWQLWCWSIYRFDVVIEKMV